MIIKLKRIFSYYIELFALSVICFFTYEFIGLGLFSVMKDSIKVSTFMYMYVRWISFAIILLYLIFRNIIGGQSILQMLYGIKYDYKNKISLIFKNVFDIMTLPISFITVLICNKSVGDAIFKTSVKEVTSYNNSLNTIFYLMMGWFTFCSLILFLGLNWRIGKSEEEFAYRLDNSQTIRDNIGFIKKFSFKDKLFWIQYDKNGEYIGATVINDDNKKFNIKAYRDSEKHAFTSIIINGEKFEYEIERFDLDKYKSDYAVLFLEFTDEINVSEIIDETSAKEAAREAYKIKYPDSKFRYRGYRIYYDGKNDCYMICYVEEMNYTTIGGCATIIIDGSGKVLLISLGE